MLGAGLLLLDEPYSSLDPEGVELVTALIADARRDGGASILVTHDIARATKVADRLVTLDDGRIAPWTPSDVVEGESSPVRSER